MWPPLSQPSWEDGGLVSHDGTSPVHIADSLPHHTLHMLTPLTVLSKMTSQVTTWHLDSQDDIFLSPT